MFKLKIDPADRMFAYYIKERDNWRCIRCHKQHERGSRSLSNSHYFNRTHENTRFDELNCDALCMLPCHHQWEKDEYNEYENFKKKQIGRTTFKKMMLSSTILVKKDRRTAYLISKQMLIDLLKSRGINPDEYFKTYKLIYKKYEITKEISRGGKKQSVNNISARSTKQTAKKSKRKKSSINHKATNSQ